MPDRWPVGAAEIRNLLDQGELQMVEASPEHADLLQRQAEAHLLSARTLMADDPAGAFALLYDAARKSISAVLVQPDNRSRHLAVGR